ncbi:hypothetical protein F5B21DRAFT_482232 [Xylaria acuta]|nr:hypothetical protein F5B21DRAFT_482232 [Xylaria acuta]
MTTSAIQSTHRDIVYCLEGSGAAYPALDNALRVFLARFTAVDPNQRPLSESCSRRPTQASQA